MRCSRPFAADNGDREYTAFALGRPPQSGSHSSDDAASGHAHRSVVPAKAGTHRATACGLWNMDPRLRGDDTDIVAAPAVTASIEPRRLAQVELRQLGAVLLHLRA